MAWTKSAPNNHSLFFSIPSADPPPERDCVSSDAEAVTRRSSCRTPNPQDEVVGSGRDPVQGVPRQAPVPKRAEASEGAGPCN